MQTLRSSLSLVLVLSVLMLICACESTSREDDPEGLNTTNGVSSTNGEAKPRQIVRPPVGTFITDTRKNRAGETVALKSFELRLESLINPDKTEKPIVGGLTADVIVFGLPKPAEGERGSTNGDTGSIYEATREMISELYRESDSWQYMASEVIEEGTVAHARISTPGFPSGMQAGSSIPVMIEALGNAKSLEGGHIYPTILRCERTSEPLALCEYTQIWEGDMISVQTWTDEIDLAAEDPCLFDAQGNRRTREAYLKCWQSERERLKREAVLRADKSGNTRFMLRDRFQLVRDTTWDETGRDEFSIHLVDDDPDTINSVTRSLEAYAPRFLSSSVRVERTIGGDITALTIVPQMRLQLSNDYYTRLLNMPIQMTPERRLHIIVDDQYARIMIIGPKQFRSLTSDFDLSEHSVTRSPRVDPNNTDEEPAFKPTGQFRVICELLDDGESMRVIWSIRAQSTGARKTGESVIRNDIGDLLRLVYSEGCPPDDCLHLIFSAQRSRALDAKLSLNPKRIKLWSDY